MITYSYSQHHMIEQPTAEIERMGTMNTYIFTNVPTNEEEKKMLKDRFLAAVKSAIRLQVQFNNCLEKQNSIDEEFTNGSKNEIKIAV